MNGKEYTIVGDSGTSKACLIYACGPDKEFAEKVLEKMLTNPDENDLAVMKDLTNLRVKEVDSKDCWWNENCD